MVTEEEGNDKETRENARKISMKIAEIRKAQRDAEQEQIRRGVRIVKWVIFGIIVITILLSSFYIISPGERGVLITLGKASEDAKIEGFHLKVPIIQSVVKMDVKTQKYTVEKASAASSDLQTVITNVAINYYINPENVPTIYKTIGINYQDKIIAPAVQEVVKANTAQYTAEELITKRPEVKEKIDIGLRDRLREFNIIVQAISITDFEFSQGFTDSIEQKVVATQLKLKSEIDLQRIKIEADQRIAQADGEAKAIKIQADAIQSQGGQAYIQKIAIDRWDGHLPVYTGGAIPFIDATIKSSA
jgi:regulator of protease activity HflC (stomatin/prohibitin superfamily)